MILIYSEMFGLYELGENTVYLRTGTILKIHNFYKERDDWVIYTGPPMKFDNTNPELEELGNLDDIKIEDMPPKLRTLLLISNLT